MTEPLLLTIPEAARRLRVSRSTAYGYARERIIPTIRIGGVVRVPADALDSWLAERQHAGEEAPRMVERVAVSAGRRQMDRPGGAAKRTRRKAPAEDVLGDGRGDGPATPENAVRYLEVHEADRPHRRRVVRKVAA